jgi:NTE family protein
LQHQGKDHYRGGKLPPHARQPAQYYWDGGILSNTPLDRVLECPDRCDTLTFQVDLWEAKGDLPRNLVEADLRQKEIRYSSRTRLSTDRFCKAQRIRRAMWELNSWPYRAD